MRGRDLFPLAIAGALSVLFVLYLLQPGIETGEGCEWRTNHSGIVECHRPLPSDFELPADTTGGRDIEL